MQSCDKHDFPTNVDLAWPLTCHRVACNNPTPPPSLQIIAPTCGVLGLVFSGFLITRENLDGWFVWIYYIK